MTRTALVLGGGGVTGIAWMTGVLHGLAEAGAPAHRADLIIGTSAGSVVGANLAAETSDLAGLYAGQLAPPDGEVFARLGTAVLLRYLRAMITSRTPEAYGRKLGAYALGASTESEEQRRAVLAGRLRFDAWPERALALTAVDALTGELRVFDKDSGVPVLDAVGASCAVPGVWPPVTIEGRKWIDGGMHSPANVELAAGYDRVLIVAPIGSGTRIAPSPRTQAAALAAAGARVEVITPGDAAKKAIGRNVLDPARRAGAARAGAAQAAAHVEAVRALLRD